MRHMRILAWVLAGALALAAHGASSAQDPADTSGTQATDVAMTTTITGKLLSSSGDTIVVEKEGGGELSLALDASATLPAGIQPGDRVTVSFDTVDGGTYRALSVEASVPVSSSTQESGGSQEAAPAADGSGAESPAGQEMPRTASPLPLLGLVGVLTIGAAAGLRALSRRSV